MSTAEIIQWVAHYLYMNGGAANKKAAAGAAEAIVIHLINKGVLNFTQQPGSATCSRCGQFISTNGVDVWRDGRVNAFCGVGADRGPHKPNYMEQEDVNA